MQESEQKLQLPIGTFWLLPVDELFKGHVNPSLPVSECLMKLIQVKNSSMCECLALFSLVSTETKHHG